jgi:2',3'-cyclic-nucleotide 2'-phosphodiesterase
VTDSIQTIDILFFGDLVGRPGRHAVKWYLASLSESEKPDVVIANVENASHGFGLTERNYNEMLNAGVHVMTGGNHIWDRKEIFDYIYSADRLIRPANFPEGNMGIGARVFDFPGFKVGVISLIGQVFMGNYNSPWEKIDALVPQLQYETPIIFVDFHAEATAEKVSFARYASTLGVSAFVGTHTHVQTADDKILNNRTGYLTDAGFCGAYDSVIGMMAGNAIDRLKTQYPTRLDVPDTTLVQVNAVRYTIEVSTGICQRVSRVNLVKDLKDDSLVAQGIDGQISSSGG